MMEQQEQEVTQIELTERKQRAQKRMAWVAIAAQIIFTCFLFHPSIPDKRIELLSEISALFYISFSGIACAFMGVTAYMSRK